MNYRKFFLFKVSLKRNYFKFCQLYFMVIREDIGFKELQFFPLFSFITYFSFPDEDFHLLFTVPSLFFLTYLIIRVIVIYNIISHVRFVVCNRDVTGSFNNYYKPRNIFFISNKINSRRITLGQTYLEQEFFSKKVYDYNGLLKIVFDSEKDISEFHHLSEFHFKNNPCKDELRILLENRRNSEFYIDYVLKKMGGNRFFCLETEKHNINHVSKENFNLYSFSNEREFIFVTEYELYYYFNPAPVSVN